MALKVAIVGLPNVGKSTLFNALTQTAAAQAANYPFCTIEANTGMVVIPDDRLERITKYIPRQEVTYAEAQGDYVRLHTAHTSHLVRIPLTVLEEHWTADGFARTHRRFLVRVTAVTEARWESGHLTVLVNGTAIPVARRHTREIRERLNHR